MKKTLLISSLVALFTINAVADSSVGSVDGMVIYKSEAENATKALSGGKMTYEKLNDAERKQVVNAIAVNQMLEKAARNGLTKSEESAAISQMWMQKKMSTTTVSDAEAQAFYNKVKADTKDKKNFPTFAKAKNQIIFDLKRNKIITGLMQGVKVIAN